MTARKLVERFRAKIRKKPPTPRFQLISINGDMIDSTGVEVREKVGRSDEQLALLYGGGFFGGGKCFLPTLPLKLTGKGILRGGPCTGQTSFFRHMFSL